MFLTTINRNSILNAGQDPLLSIGLPGIITMSIIGAVILIVVVIVKKKRGGYKSKDKEIRRIEDIRRKPKEEL